MAGFGCYPTSKLNLDIDGAFRFAAGDEWDASFPLQFDAKLQRDLFHIAKSRTLQSFGSGVGHGLNDRAKAINSLVCMACQPRGSVTLRLWDIATGQAVGEPQPEVFRQIAPDFFIN